MNANLGSYNKSELMGVVKILESRLDQIAQIIEDVDNRCIVVDGPVMPTLQEMTQKEISKIYALASAKRRKMSCKKNIK